MRDVTKDNITDVFMQYMGPDMDPRLREVMGSLVKCAKSKGIVW